MRNLSRTKERGFEKSSKSSTHYIKKMRDFKNYKVIVKEGEPSVEIIKIAKKESVKLIVMGTHGRTGLDHILFGSTAEKVVRRAPCPVLTTRLPGRKFKML
jgi:universal stress protein A